VYSKPRDFERGCRDVERSLLSLAARRGLSQGSERSETAANTPPAGRRLRWLGGWPGTRASLPPLAKRKLAGELPLGGGELAYVMPPIGAREPSR